MNVVPVTEARAHISELLDEVLRGVPVCLTRHGRNVAVLVPANFLTIGQDYTADAKQTTA